MTPTERNEREKTIQHVTTMIDVLNLLLEKANGEGIGFTLIQHHGPNGTTGFLITKINSGDS